MKIPRFGRYAGLPRAFFISRSTLLVALNLALATHATFAGSATWKQVNSSGGFWNYSDNWTPATVPNSPTDVATFSNSDTIYIQTLVDTEVDSIVFDQSSSAYTISSGGPNTDFGLTLTVSGTGIIDNSGVPQNFVTTGGIGQINFTNSASAGGTTIVFTNNPYVNTGFFDIKDTNFYDSATAGMATFINKAGFTFVDGATNFFDNSTADHGVFINTGPVLYPYSGGSTNFSGNSTAANGTFSNFPGTGEGGGSTSFADTATAGDAVITNYGGDPPNTYIPGGTSFAINSTAGNALITNKGGSAGGAGGSTTFSGSGSGGNATITNEAGTDAGSSGGSSFFVFGGDGGDATFIAEGATVDGAFGGAISFSQGSTAGKATLVAYPGLGVYGGGVITFENDANGDRARVEIFGNGELLLHAGVTINTTIGSLEGDGMVSMNFNNLTVGSNGQDTTFHGRIFGRGQVIKVGKGTLTLSGNVFHGAGAVINEGELYLSSKGSNSGPSSVQVDGGTLAGPGTVKGRARVGSNRAHRAVLAPGRTAVSTNIFTILGTVSFASDGVLSGNLNSDTAMTTQVVSNGVAIDPAATIELDDSGNTGLPAGTVFTLVSNTSLTAISGRFANLPDGGTITVGSNTFEADYEGGDGNDLTLTVI